MTRHLASRPPGAKNKVFSNIINIRWHIIDFLVHSYLNTFSQNSTLHQDAPFDGENKSQTLGRPH